MSSGSRPQEANATACLDNPQAVPLPCVPIRSVGLLYTELITLNCSQVYFTCGLSQDKDSEYQETISYHWRSVPCCSYSWEETPSPWPPKGNTQAGSQVLNGEGAVSFRFGSQVLHYRWRGLWTNSLKLPKSSPHCNHERVELDLWFLNCGLSFHRAT